VEIFTEAEESLVLYLAGWLARKCGICAKCQEVLSKRLDDHSYCCRQTYLFAKCKRFAGTASVGLVEPCDELIAAVHVMEQVFRVLVFITSALSGICKLLTSSRLTAAAATELFILDLSVYM